MNKQTTAKVIETVELPEGLTAEISHGSIKIRGSGKENVRTFKSSDCTVKLNGKKIEIFCTSTRRKALSEAGALASHVRNLVRGLQNEYVYKLEIVFSHFPLNVAVKGTNVEISNLGGAKHAVKAKILEGTKVEVKGKDITVKGINKEAVGQTAANMEAVTRIKGKDIRVFHDGIYIVSRD